MPDNPIEQIPAQGGHVAPAIDPSAPQRLIFTATGIYPRAIPLDLKIALLVEIQKHMEAYGFKDITAEARGEQTNA